ncbi:diacylglycerol/lipid kinase family protein [Carnobacterium gallinarum]|uniref:diacylglycerol/lipid kinase family protein n=1 Tax=Carnobacterium gallinarum TaxID=2749 RepID=UPI000550E97F|nr:diacylglycerol kinase family protein [Carnobacterium gallinarum]
MKNVMLIFNPASGKSQSENIAKQVKIFLEKEDTQCEVKLMGTQNESDATKFAKEAAEQKFDLVVSIGGDGTISDIVSGLSPYEQRPKLGIIPAGTVNNLARVLKIPLKIEDAIKNLITGGKTPMDVGQVNEAYMISTLTIGVLADAALSVSQKEKQKFGPFAFLFKGGKILLRHKHYSLRIQEDTDEWNGAAQLVLITMTNSAGGFPFLDPDARIDDGYFHVFIVPELSFINSLKFFPYFISGNAKKIPNLTYIKSKKLTITGPKTKKEVRSRIDGDPSEKVPLKMRVLEGHIQVLAPTKEN